ncbi:alginate export family protein [Bdellovibrio sp. HCB290]|uniref:alginate export family protein n=1 Tax=Bdellovibrio sp. HCB290 TaxID=3394356 RepID=UPI0039B4C14C
MLNRLLFTATTLMLSFAYAQVPEQPSSTTSITSGGYFRWSQEWFHHPNFGRGTDESQGYFLQRYLAHVEVKDTETGVRGYLQAKYSEIANKFGNASSTDRDNGDIHQAFFENRYIRAGRQESPVGSTLLVGVREGPNSRLSFDGLKGFINSGINTELFLGHPVDINSGFVDNRPADTILGYVYLTSGVKLEPFSADLFAMYYDDFTSKLYTIGARWIYKTESASADTDFMLQYGRYDDDLDVQAYGVASRIKVPLIASLEATTLISYFSGDQDPNDGQYNTFNALFPRGQYYGWSAEIGHPNVIAVVPGLTWHISDMLAWLNNVALYWRESIHDGVYRGSGSLLRPATNDQRYTATQLNSSAEWKINKLFSIYYEYSYTMTGDFIEDSTDSDDSQYFAIRTALRF